MLCAKYSFIKPTKNVRYNSNTKRPKLINSSYFLLSQRISFIFIKFKIFVFDSFSNFKNKVWQYKLMNVKDESSKSLIYSKYFLMFSCKIFFYPLLDFEVMLYFFRLEWINPK